MSITSTEDPDELIDSFLLYNYDQKMPDPVLLKVLENDISFAVQSLEILKSLTFRAIGLTMYPRFVNIYSSVNPEKLKTE